MTDLDTLLTRCDFVSVNCDLNPGSHHLLGRQAFAKMKSAAVLINTARGPIVDESALVEALQNRQIAGAAMDVFEMEPLPADSQLRTMDNVLFAPHNSNSSPSAWERVHHSTIRNLLQGSECGPLEPLRMISAAPGWQGRARWRHDENCTYHRRRGRHRPRDRCSFPCERLDR